LNFEEILCRRLLALFVPSRAAADSVATTDSTEVKKLALREFYSKDAIL